MNDEDKLSYAVRKYLLKNPDFFVKNPELLTELEVASQQGELTDLTTHQLKALQKENRKIKSQLSQLIANAQQSEILMDRLLSLVTELSTVDKNSFLAGFVDNVIKNFPSDYFKILLTEELSDAVADHVATITADQKSQFAAVFEKSEALSGRLKSEQVNSIFTPGHEIKSAIVLPIGPQAAFGLMSFASKDEEKFHPHSSTDILQKLSQILANHFSTLSSAVENQPTTKNDVDEPPTLEAGVSP